MRRLLSFTIIILGLGVALLLLLRAMSGITMVVARDRFEPPLENIPQVSEGDYLPEGLGGLRMSMPLSEFHWTVHGQHGVHEVAGFRETVTTGYEATDSFAVGFCFASEAAKPRCEFIIEFPEAFDLSACAAERYGEPPHEDEWRFRDTNDDYVMI